MMRKPRRNQKLAIAAVFLLIAIVIYNYNTGTLFRCKGHASCITAKVERIIDGDTLVIANKTVRLALVNAPEKNEELSKEAENFTANLCKIGTEALVDEDDGQLKGSYGRLVGVVYCKGKNLNELLLDNGFGTIYVSFCKTSEFKNEKWAKYYGC